MEVDRLEAKQTSEVTMTNGIPCTIKLFLRNLRKIDTDKICSIDFSVALVQGLQIKFTDPKQIFP